MPPLELIRFKDASRAAGPPIRKGSPGPECFTNRDGHAARDTVLPTASGRILVEPFPALTSVEGDGDEVRELMTGDGKSIGKFDGGKFVPLPGVSPTEAERGS
jgi:hypothetical protein